MSPKITVQVDNLDFNKSKSMTFIENDFFQIRRNKKVYTITSHNFLPIKNNITHKDITYNVRVNCKWNEVLVLYSDELPDNSLIFNKIRSKICSTVFP